MKVCSICKEEKSSDDFQKDRWSKDQLISSCKECSNKRKRELRATGVWKDNELAYGKKYRKTRQHIRTRIEGTRRARRKKCARHNACRLVEHSIIFLWSGLYESKLLL